jgi:hypothetical protein
MKSSKETLKSQRRTIQQHILTSHGIKSKLFSIQKIMFNQDETSMMLTWVCEETHNEVKTLSLLPGCNIPKTLGGNGKILLSNFFQLPPSVLGILQPGRRLSVFTSLLLF